MKKWILRILIFTFLFLFIAAVIYVIIFAWQRFLLILSLTTVISIPMWIRAVAIRSWTPMIKKISIVMLLVISTTFSLYIALKPSVNTTQLSMWAGNIAVTLYFVACGVSAYLNWPGRPQKTKKSIHSSPKKQSARKNRNYVVIPMMTGTDGDASVTFLNATFQKVNESKKRFPDPDFGAWLIEQIYSEKKMMAERRGAFKKKLYCPSCDGELSPEIREPKQIEYELQYHDFDPFKMQITIPSVVCPQCGKVCGMDLDGSLSNYLGDAIIAAFKSVNIKP